jgi:hypothetical protein
MWVTLKNTHSDWRGACGEIVDNPVSYPQFIHILLFIHILPLTIHRLSTKLSTNPPHLRFVVFVSIILCFLSKS